MRAVYNYLEFTQITSNDQGRYYCTASSPYGNSTKVAEVIVHHHEVPNREHAQVGRVLEAIEGDTISLECNEPSSAGVSVSSALRSFYSQKKTQQNRFEPPIFPLFSSTGGVKMAKFHDQLQLILIIA